MHTLDFEKLTIYEVESLYTQLQEWVQNDSSLELDLANIHKIDFAAIQLLVSASKSIDLKLSNVSMNVNKQFELSGVKELLLGGVDE